MPDPGPVSDPTVTALAWASSCGIETRPWPPTTPASVATEAGGAPDHPILYLVDPDADPPACTGVEDWIRRPLDLHELTSRCDRLLADAESVGAVPIRIDDDDILRVGGDLRILSPVDARLLRLLIERAPAVADHNEIVAVVWPEGSPEGKRIVSGPIKRLRDRIEGLPLELEAVWGGGLRLVRLAAEHPAPRPGRTTPPLGRAIHRT